MNATGAIGAYCRANILGLESREINCGLAGGLSSRRGLCTDSIERTKGGGESVNQMHENYSTLHNKLRKLSNSPFVHYDQS